MNLNDIFNSENKNQAVVVLLITFMVIVVIVCIYVLVIIWSPSDTNNQKEKLLSIGEFEKITVTEEDMVKQYFAKVFALMINRQYTELYQILDPLYIKEYNVTEESLKEYIENKGINVIGLELEKYEKSQMEGYSNIYTIQVRILDEGILERIIIKEFSPTNIKVAFNDYLAHEITSVGVIKDGLKFILHELELNNNQYSITASITNTLDETIILNKDKEIYSIQAITDMGDTISTVSDTITGQAVEIKSGETYNYKGIFSKSHSFNNIAGLYIPSIYYKTSNRYSSLNFTF